MISDRQNNHDACRVEQSGCLPDSWGDDTIAAISTATGCGAIGIVRLSGPRAIEIAAAAFRPAGASRLPEESHRLHYGHMVDPAGNLIDEVLVGVMRAPRTYTREDVIEINCHGGAVAQRAILRALIALGARPAEPGEFTRRAFLNGRIDLTQAESVASIVAARSTGALRASVRQLEGGLSARLRAARRVLLSMLAAIEATVDFSDEDVDEVDWTALADGLTGVKADLSRLLETALLGRMLENGVRTAIVGRPNVGKSSLLNALLMRERAIVSEIPGTTRDTVEELMEIGGIPIHLVDTAGMRCGGDHIEQLGVQRSIKAMEQADLVLAVIDLSTPWGKSEVKLLRQLDGRRSIIVGSKKDLVDEQKARDLAAMIARACRRDPLVSAVSTGLGPTAVDASSAAGAPLEDTKSSGGHVGVQPWRQCSVSAVTGEGLDVLREIIQQLVTSHHGVHMEEPVLATERQRNLVSEAVVAMGAAIEGARRHHHEELVCEDIRTAVSALGRITGEELTPDLLDEIFSRFCLGK